MKWCRYKIQNNLLIIYQYNYHISSYIIIYHHISSYIIIYHHISSYIIIYHHISSYIIIYHHISSYIIIYHHISSYIIIYLYDYTPSRPSNRRPTQIDASDPSMAKVVVKFPTFYHTFIQTHTATGTQIYATGWWKVDFMQRWLEKTRSAMQAGVAAKSRPENWSWWTWLSNRKNAKCPLQKWPLQVSRSTQNKFLKAFAGKGLGCLMCREGRFCVDTPIKMAKN